MRCQDPRVGCGRMADSQRGDELAAKLRQLHDAAGSPSLRKIADAINSNATTVGQALNGTRPTSWEVVEELVKHFQGDRDDFKQLWDAARAAGKLPRWWKHGVAAAATFVGRADELARLDRWAGDPRVRLVGLSSWGGAGKTALVTHWVNQAGGDRSREGLRGVFWWSFYDEPSADAWAQTLLSWGRQKFPDPKTRAERKKPPEGAPRGEFPPGQEVLKLLTRVPLLLVLDGLEVNQKSHEEQGFGKFLDGPLQEVLTGVCQSEIEHGSLVVLTSRFRFEDLETFDGQTARMREVPPLTADEGSELLAACGGNWLAEEKRRKLVEQVHGHALAVTALGGALADRPPEADVDRLLAELAAAGRTDARVTKVLHFYGNKLPEADRFLMAAVSLLPNPATASSIAAVAKHPVFAGRLDSWAEPQIEAAARNRLPGLLYCRPDGTLSAHPLVRDAFRPLALGAAHMAANIAMNDAPATSYGPAWWLRFVEVIELLAEAGLWKQADINCQNFLLPRGEPLLDPHRRHQRRPDMTPPAYLLRLRAAAAFVGTKSRRDDCRAHLGPDGRAFYDFAMGSFAMRTDLSRASEYLRTAVTHQQKRGASQSDRSAVLMELADCHSWLGNIEDARTAGADALRCDIFPLEKMDCHACLGQIEMLAGNTAAAETHFIKADRIHYRYKSDGTDWHLSGRLPIHRPGQHLLSVSGANWAEFLARTGRAEAARVLAERNRKISAEVAASTDVAYYDRVLARLDLAVGDAHSATWRLESAAQTFRDADNLIELAATLPMLADAARTAGTLDTADRHVQDALIIAGPRKAVTALAAAQTAWARIDAARSLSGGAGHIDSARDHATAAERLATNHQLPWHTLDACQVQAHLDELTGADNGYAIRVNVLQSRLIPAGLAPNPNKVKSSQTQNGHRGTEPWSGRDVPGSGRPDRPLR